MNNPYFSEVAMLSPVVGTAVILPAEPVTGGIMQRRQMVDYGRGATQETSPREPATIAGRARSWGQRLLAIAAHNPPHPL